MHNKMLGIFRLSMILLLSGLVLLTSACDVISLVPSPTTSTSSTTATTTTTSPVPPSYGLTVNLQGMGNITRSPDQQSYNDGAPIQLTATPNPGWTFSGWISSDINISNPTANPLAFNMLPKAAVITATFIQITSTPSTYILAINANNGNVVKNPDQSSYTSGTSVQITAIPAAGYAFNGWSGNLSGSANPAVITIDSNTNITANFVAVSYDLLTSVSPAGGGSVNPSGGSYESGTSITLTATPNSGYQFSSWSGDLSGTSPSTVITMDRDESVIAYFAQIPYSLTINEIGSGTVIKNPNQATYASGTSVQLTAIPAAGYSFTGWSGDLNGNANPTVITMDSNTNITANFVAVSYNLSTSVSPAGGGSVNPSGGSYESGTSITLTATPNIGYQFTSWSGDISGTSPSTVITMDRDENVIANFAQVIPPTPSQPVGPSTGQVQQTLIFTTSIQSNMTGPIEYEFDWGDGMQTSSDLPSASHAWSSAGTYSVKAQINVSGILSAWSSATNVMITLPPTTTSQIPEVITYTMPPGALSGSSVSYSKTLSGGDVVSGSVDLTGTYYSIDWSYAWTFQILGPGGESVQEWTGNWVSNNHHDFTFTASYAGTYTIKVSHVSNYSKNLTLTILPPGWGYSGS